MTQTAEKGNSVAYDSKTVEMERTGKKSMKIPEMHDGDEYSDKCFKKERKTPESVTIKASLVQKAIEARKESLMALARASLGITDPEPLPANPEPTETNGLTVLSSPIGLKRAAPDEQVEMPDRGSKNARKTNSEVLTYKSKRKARSKGKEDERRVDPKLEHRQLEVPSGNEESSPYSRYSSPISVMNTRSGEDSFRLYKACLLPADEAALASMAHCKLEEIAAHNLMRVAAVMHQLTLQCTKLQKDLEEKDRGKERDEGEVRVENEERLSALECQLSKLKAWGEEAEKALLKSKLEIEKLKQHGQESFEAGRAAGRLEMTDSDEFRSAIRQARVSGAKEYLASPSFELIMARKAAEHEVIGFVRCQSQVLKLGGLKEGFNLESLDPAMGGNLEPAEAENEENASEEGDVEFANLKE